MAKIYSSGNYVIVDDGVKLYEYAKGHTLYTLVDDVFYIKEITQGQFKVSVADLDAGNITSEDSGDVYTVGTFTTFLRDNTGFKTAAGGSAATVQNSDLSYTTTVNSGDTLNLPNITVTDSDGSTFTAPSVQNITCTPAVAPVGATLMKTGQTTSYRTGDDGDIEAGRATSFTVLASNNPFGNTNRFTDELGGQTYTNNIVIDWSTYNGSTVLGLSRAAIATGKTWNNSIDECLAFSIAPFTTGWRLPNMKEIFNLVNYGNAPENFLNYAPLNLSSNGRVYWSSNTNISASTSAYFLSNVGNTGQTAKTTSVAFTYFPVRTFTVTGTTLT